MMAGRQTGHGGDEDFNQSMDAVFCCFVFQSSFFLSSPGKEQGWPQLRTCLWEGPCSFPMTFDSNITWIFGTCTSLIELLTEQQQPTVPPFCPFFFKKKKTTTLTPVPFTYQCRLDAIWTIVVLMLKAARSGPIPGSVRDTNKTRQYQNDLFVFPVCS